MFHIASNEGSGLPAGNGGYRRPTWLNISLMRTAHRTFESAKSHASKLATMLVTERGRSGGGCTPRPLSESFSTPQGRQQRQQTVLTKPVHRAYTADPPVVIHSHRMNHCFQGVVRLSSVSFWVISLRRDDYRGTSKIGQGCAITGDEVSACVGMNCLTRNK